MIIYSIFCRYNIPFFLDNMGPLYSEWSVNAHEARPGHHTQVVQFYFFQTRLFYMICWFSFIWALFCASFYSQKLWIALYARSQRQWNNGFVIVTYIISVQIIAHLTVRKFYATLTLNKKSVMVNIGGNVVKSQYNWNCNSIEAPNWWPARIAISLVSTSVPEPRL